MWTHAFCVMASRCKYFWTPGYMNYSNIDITLNFIAMIYTEILFMADFIIIFKHF